MEKEAILQKLVSNVLEISTLTSYRDEREVISTLEALIKAYKQQTMHYKVKVLKKGEDTLEMVYDHKDLLLHDMRNFYKEENIYLPTIKIQLDMFFEGNINEVSLCNENQTVWFVITNSEMSMDEFEESLYK